MISWSGHGRTARGGHGLPKVSFGPPCPTLKRPAGGPLLKQPDGCFRGGPPIRRVALAIFFPLVHPTPYTYGPGVATHKRGRDTNCRNIGLILESTQSGDGLLAGVGDDRAEEMRH
jgi:hypothetical protein